MVSSNRGPDTFRGPVPVTAELVQRIAGRLCGDRHQPWSAARSAWLSHVCGAGSRAWFREVDEKTFIERYMAQLASLDACQVLRDLARLADGNVPTLLCFEKPPPDAAWCHRGMAAAWLKESADVDVHELGFDGLGSGWSHPKLPSGLRRPPAPSQT